MLVTGGCGGGKGSGGLDGKATTDGLQSSATGAGPWCLVGKLGPSFGKSGSTGGRAATTVPCDGSVLYGVQFGYAGAFGTAGISILGRGGSDARALGIASGIRDA